MQRLSLPTWRWPALCVASLLLGCPASESSGETDTTADSSTSSSGEDGGSTTTGASAASSAASDEGGPSTSSADMTTTGPNTAGESSDSGACPADAECSGPDDPSCAFGGTCLACGCIGGEPPTASYGECDACLPDEWPLDEGIGCVCMPQCEEKELCPPLPGRPEPGVQDPACYVGGFEGCLIPCNPAQGQVCPSEMTCQMLSKSEGYCTFELVP